MAHPLVQMRSIVKKFPGVVANDHVDLDIYAGEIHALLGENGSGKSTIMSVLAGLYRPDAGEILIDGEPFAFTSPRDAIAAGIAVIGGGQAPGADRGEGLGGGEVGCVGHGASLTAMAAWSRPEGVRLASPRPGAGNPAPDAPSCADAFLHPGRAQP